MIYLIHVYKSYIYTHTSFRKKSIYFIYNTFWNPSIWSLSKDFLSVSVFHFFLAFVRMSVFIFLRGLLLTLKFLPIIKYVISFFMLCKKKVCWKNGTNVVIRTFGYHSSHCFWLFFLLEWRCQWRQISIITVNKGSMVFVDMFMLCATKFELG